MSQGRRRGEGRVRDGEAGEGKHAGRLAGGGEGRLKERVRRGGGGGEEVKGLKLSQPGKKEQIRTDWEKRGREGAKKPGGGYMGFGDDKSFSPGKRWIKSSLKGAKRKGL